MKRSFPVSAILFLFGAVALSQIDGTGPYANLVMEGIPRVPASLQQQVDRYSVFQTVEFMGWHPVKREMLIRTYGYNPRRNGQIHRVEYPGGWFWQLTFFADPVAGISYHRPKGDYLVFSKDSDGNELYQMYRYDCGTGRVTPLTNGKSRNTSGTWSHADRQIAYLSARRNGKDLDLYLIDPSHPHSDRLLAPLRGEVWSVQSWSPDDRRIVLGQYVSDRESYLWLLDVVTGKKQLLTPRDSACPAAYGSSVFSKDGRDIYTLSNRRSEFWRLVDIDLATKRQTPLTHLSQWDVSSFTVTGDRRTLAFVTNEDGAGILHLLDMASRKERPVDRLPLGVITGMGWHKNGRDLGFTFESAHFQSDAYAVDARTGRIERWTDSQTRGLHAEEFAEPERVHWRSFDERSISGLLYRPPASFTGKRPVIIDIHGGPEAQARPDYMGGWNYYINGLGVALICPNVRGSAGYGKTFLDLDNGFQREGAYRDIGALLGWIRTRPELDADRIMVTGASYGGHMALAVAAMYNDRIRCTIDEAGPSNLVTFLERRVRGSDMRRTEYGDEREPRMRAFLERIAPLNNAGKITKPLFIVQGANDPRVPLGEAQQMVEAVRRNGTPVWYLMAWNEGHGFSKPASVNFLSYAEALFVKEYLLR
jgi:dipeptidyl aminopeptidase/acylaminoacyl peptidase